MSGDERVPMPAQLRIAEEVGVMAASRSLADMEAVQILLIEEMQQLPERLRSAALVMLWVSFISRLSGHMSVRLGPHATHQILTTLATVAKEQSRAH
jgi:hypothetical protein